MMRRPPRSTPLYSSAASDVYKRQNRNRWPKVLNDIAVPLLRGLVTRSLAAVKFASLHLPLQGRVKRAPERPALRIPRELVPREYVDLALRDIDPVSYTHLRAHE